MTSRFIPLIGAGLLLGSIWWRAWLHSRRYGGWGILLFRSGRTRQNVRDALGVVLFLSVMGQAIAAAVRPASLSPLGMISPQATATWQWIGAGVLFGGLVLMIIGQINLGSSWRVGIEEGARPGLVATGLYSFCRNPVFLGMFVTLIGYTVLLLTWLSLVMLVGALVGIRQQAVEEEAYLLRAYRDEYRAYAGRVGRFLPGVGRLR